MGHGARLSLEPWQSNPGVARVADDLAQLYAHLRDEGHSDSYIIREMREYALAHLPKDARSVALTGKPERSKRNDRSAWSGYTACTSELV